MTDLRELLEVATDRVEPTGLAQGAWAAARRRRTARRGILASAAVAVVVLGVAVAVRLGDKATVQPAPAPASTTAATNVLGDVVIAPDIAVDRVQRVWDPRDAEGQPVLELGVPRVMESLTPGEVSQPVALLDDGTQARLVSADGRVEDLRLPSGLAEWRDVSLSPDGRRLVASGASGFYWRELDGDWHRVESGDVPAEAQLTWLPDSSGVVVRGWQHAVLIDLPSGEVTQQPFLQGVDYLDVAADGTFVGVTDSYDVASWRAGREVGRVHTAVLEGLTLPATDASDIAFARGNVSTVDPPSLTDRDGLLVVDRTTFETRAFLPVPNTYYYVHAEELRPITWLDDNTLLFTVLPEEAPKEYLMAWNVETGAISRVSCWERSVDAVFATDRLG